MPPRLGSTICYGQELARKSHQDSAVRFVTAKRGPERATETRQYDLLRPNMGQKEPPRLGSTICYGQVLSRKSHPDSAIRFVMAKSWPEKATKTRQYDLLRLNVGQKEKSCPDKATKTRPYVLLRPIVGQKKPPRLGSTSCYGQTWARKSHQDSAVRFVTAKSWPERATETRQYDLILPNLGQIVTAKSWPEKATKTRQYDLLRPRIGQKEPPRLGSTIVTAKRGPERATKTRQYDLLRPNVGQKEPPRLGSTICYGQELARKSHRDSAVRFVTAKRGPERAIKTRQYDLLRPRVGQKKLPRLGNTICYGQEWARKSHQDSAVRFVMAKSWPENATKTRQYDLLLPNVGLKEPSRLGSTICYGQELARKSHRDSAVRFVAAKRGPERATKTRSCHSQELARKSHQDSAVRFVTAKRGPERATKTRQYDLLRPRVWPERATKTRQYDLLRPNVCQKKPPRLGSTICYGQELARKCHQDSAVRFVTAKSWPERATKTRQYDLLRPKVGQKEPPRLGSTICYDQTWARKSHQDSAV